MDRTSGHHAAVLAFASLVAVVLCDSPAFANGKLSFDDWLARQGTRCKDLDGDGNCCEPYDDQYIPANRSFINWFDPTGRAVVIDYLGLSGSYLAASCGVDLGTETTGTVTAHQVKDGRVLVSVRGHTRNALAYAVEGFDPNGPLLFGNREADVCSGEPASVVDVEFVIQYYADASQPIADNQWFGNPPPVGCETTDDPFEFRFLALRAEGIGTLPDGTPAVLIVNQTGTLQSNSQADNFDGFPVEFIELHPVR